VCARVRVCAHQDNHKLSYIQQLRPTQAVQPRIKLKLFGHPGVGKSALLESLKCGILRGLFRRKRTRMTNASRHPNSPVTSKPAGRSRWSLRGQRSNTERSKLHSAWRVDV